MWKLAIPTTLLELKNVKTDIERCWENPNSKQDIGAVYAGVKAILKLADMKF